jgi:hypothetical protein
MKTRYRNYHGYNSKIAWSMWGGDGISKALGWHKLSPPAARARRNVLRQRRVRDPLTRLHLDDWQRSMLDRWVKHHAP